jgi:hypothetical protein
LPRNRERKSKIKLVITDLLLRQLNPALATSLFYTKNNGDSFGSMISKILASWEYQTESAAQKDRSRYDLWEFLESENASYLMSVLGKIQCVAIGDQIIHSSRNLHSSLGAISLEKNDMECKFLIFLCSLEY